MQIYTVDTRGLVAPALSVKVKKPGLTGVRVQARKGYVAR